MTEDSTTVSAPLAPIPAALRAQQPFERRPKRLEDRVKPGSNKRKNHFAWFPRKKPRTNHALNVGSSQRGNGRGQKAFHDQCDPFEGLNDAQKQAVQTCLTNACYVHAGPGCGKTRVLTRRFAYLVKHHGVSSRNILAVTFTNKAAEEMKNKVITSLLGSDPGEEQIKNFSAQLPVGTFHSLCGRFLREYGSAIDIPSNFGIADTPDCRKVLKRVVKNSTIPKENISNLLSCVSRVKMDVAGEEKLKNEMASSAYLYVVQMRKEYDEELRRMKLLDFDDMLLEMRKLLLRSPDTLCRLQNRFEHVLVDEWQDTNRVQFDLVSMLASKRQNLFVVGDTDQSVYSFRGASGGTETEFVQLFPQAARVWLGTNYRSSGCIVQAAQHVIEQAKDRPQGKMVAVKEFGSKVQVWETRDEKAEAQFIARTLNHLVQSKKVPSFSDAALLYRTNRQCRSLEEACIDSEVPYYIRTGVKFYERKDIKDLLCYVRLIANMEDNNAFLRVVNTPKRHIGKVTCERIEKFAIAHNMSMDTAANAIVREHRLGYPVSKMTSAAVENLGRFCDLMSNLRLRSRKLLREEDIGPESTEDLITVGNLISEIVKVTNFQRHLRETKDGSREDDRNSSLMDNIEELIRGAAKYNKIHDFLTTVALMTDADRDVKKSSEGAVALMTLHGAKGLEYDVVFIAGAEDGLIPLERFMDNTDYEEERRLLYVGMTRAKKMLYITWRLFRTFNSGESFLRQRCSRFLRRVPEVLASFAKLDENV